MKRILYFILINILLSGCSHKENRISDSFKEIDISTKTITEKINLSYFANATKVIQLETSENCFLNAIDKIDFCGDTILILYYRQIRLV
ncbi:MAG: lipoprotein [Bacteroidales bacterium]